MATQHKSTPLEIKQSNCYETLQYLFNDCDASGYIQSLNEFIRPVIEEPTHEQSFSMYNLLKLMEVLARLERQVL